MKSWGYDIHSFEAFNMNFGYFVQDLALTLSTRGIIQKRLKTSLNNILVETQGGVESFSDQIWCLDSVSDFKKDLFYLTWAKGILILKKIMPKNKLLTLRHIETKPTQQVALIVNQGLGFYICVNWSCSSHIALILLLMWGNPKIDSLTVFNARA